MDLNKMVKDAMIAVNEVIKFRVDEVKKFMAYELQQDQQKLRVRMDKMDKDLLG